MNAEQYYKLYPADKITELETTEIFDFINSAYEGSKNDIGLFKASETTVFAGGNNDIDREYCLKNNIPIVDFGFHSGSIVTTPSDLGIGLVTNDEANLRDDVLTKLGDFVSQNTFEGEKAYQDKNDLLIDGKKFCGSVIVEYGDMRITYFQVSVVISKHLNSICQKQRLKEPMGLSEVSDIDKHQLLDFFKKLTGIDQ